jgi:hypothetical protein
VVVDQLALFCRRHVSLFNPLSRSVMALDDQR